MASRSTPSTCLFLPELPADVGDGVLERHFRGFTGFSNCRTRFDRNGKLVGFVEFETVDDAVRSRDSMQGQSPFPGVSWHIHFSNNTKGAAPGVKRPREGGQRDPVGRADAQRPATGIQQQPMMAPPQPYMQQPPPQQIQQPMMAPPGAYAPPMGHPPQPNYMAMSLPADASSTLYIEGLPTDSTEREVSHIFRRFDGQGYQSLRLIARDSQKAIGTKLFLCFVEFDNAHQATVAMQQLQGYRIDKTADAPGIKISYSRQKSRPPAERPPLRPPAESREPRSSSYDDRDDGRDRDRDRDRGRDRDRDDRYDGHRRDGREHRDSFHDDDSERDDAYSMDGVEGSSL